MRCELYYFAKPWVVTQQWGTLPLDPDTGRSIYDQFGFVYHNGIDVALSKDRRVRAEFRGEVVRTGWQPQGGGLYMTVLSDDVFDFDDGKRARLYVDYLHLDEFKRFPGRNYRFKVGDILAIGDNTGFSTGPHTHAQYRRVVNTPNGLQEIDKNDANNTLDVEKYRNGVYAEDITGIPYTLNEIYNQLIDLLNKRNHVWNSFKTR